MLTGDAPEASRRELCTRLACGGRGSQSGAALELRSVSPAHPQVGVILESNVMFPFLVDDQTRNALQVHDCGPVNSAEHVRVEGLRQLRDAASQQVHLSCDVQ